MIRLTSCSLALVVLGAPSLAAQNPMERMGAVRREIQARNGRAALQLLRSIEAEVPGHPNVVYLRADAYDAATMQPIRIYRVALPR